MAAGGDEENDRTILEAELNLLPVMELLEQLRKDG